MYRDDAKRITITIALITLIVCGFIAIIQFCVWPAMGRMVDNYERKQLAFLTQISDENAEVIKVEEVKDTLGNSQYKVTINDNKDTVQNGYISNIGLKTNITDIHDSFVKEGILYIPYTYATEYGITAE